MARTDRLSNIASIYDKRAPTYDTDTGFHPTQAADYIKWMSLKPGQNVLDLACGTGAVTILAKREVGSSGTVIGIDISSTSLVIAREKAEKLDLHIKFVLSDIGVLDGVDGMEEFFDFITCASAFMLLDNPDAAVKRWTKLLRPGGRMIFDVPTDDSMIRGLVLDQTAQELGVPMVYNRMEFGSREFLLGLLNEAGLDTKESFVTESYDEVREIDAGKAGEIFEEMVVKTNWFRGWYAELVSPSKRDVSKRVFCRELEKLANKDGKVKEQLRFHIAVGKKI